MRKKITRADNDDKRDDVINTIFDENIWAETTRRISTICCHQSGENIYFVLLKHCSMLILDRIPTIYNTQMDRSPKSFHRTQKPDDLQSPYDLLVHVHPCNILNLDETFFHKFLPKTSRL